MLAATLLALLAFTAPARALAPAAELAVPKNDGWVTDLAGMLSSTQERELETLMESYKQGTTHEIALLTIPSLEGDDLERFALRVGRAWGIGGKDKNNGALLLVSKADRKIRIEVGRGLEGNLNDALCGRIIRDVIAPRFKAGQFAAGLKAGVVAMHEAIGGDYSKLPVRRGGGQEIGGALVPLIIILVVITMILARINRGSGWRRSRGLWGPIFWSGGFGGGGGSRGGGSFGGFSGFGGGGGFSGGGASGGW